MLDVRQVCAVFSLTTGACAKAGGVDPQTAYEAGDAIQVQAKLAQAHLALCKTDISKCDAVSPDLEKIVETSTNLKANAVSAGAKP